MNANKLVMGKTAVIDVISRYKKQVHGLTFLLLVPLEVRG